MHKIKTIAMYLPQFHEVSENSQWWGEGYTEWTAVRNAERLFEGHYQPREPLGDNYYDLMNKSIFEWQAGLASEYGVDGFCFYHYYFKDGRKILEKPAENLLTWKDINMPFCFCWANETWARTWSKVGGSNIWSDKFERSNEGENPNGILLQQSYGRERAWQEHFMYLLPFFKDSRYIRIDGVPLFLIYKPQDISCLAEMMSYWKFLAKENGLKDIYCIGMNTTQKLYGLDAVLYHGPAMYWKEGMAEKKVKWWVRGDKMYIDYEDMWRYAVSAKKIPGCRTYYNAFTDYDDTPRRGSRGCMCSNASVEVFEKYLYLLMKKNQAAGNEYVFINAFNEWGEGMYLEPDKKNGYQYLEALKRVKERANGEEAQVVVNEVKDTVQEQNNEQYRIEKFRSYFLLMDKWMDMRERDLRLGDYLKDYHEVAVYGLGILGRHLMSELIRDGVEVKYIIDKNEKVQYPGIKVCRLAPGLERVDAIIVTAIYEYRTGNIWKEIRDCGIDCPILSLEEIIGWACEIQ